MKMKRKKQKFITCIDDRYKYILMNISAWKLCLKKEKSWKLWPFHQPLSINYLEWHLYRSLIASLHWMPYSNIYFPTHCYVTDSVVWQSNNLAFELILLISDQGCFWWAEPRCIWSTLDPKLPEVPFSWNLILLAQEFPGEPLLNSPLHIMH